MAAFTLKTFGDLVNAVREELKISASDTSAINRLKRDINIVYSEVIAAKRWWWMLDATTLNIPAYYQVGTCRVIHGSNVVKFSTPVGEPKEGYYFSVNSDSEIYKIESHTAGSDEIRLSQEYNGATNFTATFKIWTDRIPLPTNAKETVEVLNPVIRAPLENLGLQEFRRLSSSHPKQEGSPQCYFTSDFIEPFPDEAVAGLPALLEKSSQGVIKKLVFVSAVPASVVAGVQLRIKAANNSSYNGEVKVSKIETTYVANDTITYIGKEEHFEPLGGDSSLQVRKLITTTDRSRYRELNYYPALNQTPVVLHLDYQKNVAPLDADADEPLVPLDDRIVLLYGALNRAWRRERNTEEANTNLQLYRDTLARMAGHIQDSLDKPIIKPSRTYLGEKRSSFRSRRFSLVLDGFAGGGSASSGGSTVAVLGTPNTVGIFNASGELEGSSVVSVAELNYLDGASANIQNQIDTINTTISSAFVTNALVSPTAAIARSKLASGTASRVIVNDGSGVMAESSVNSTELSFLSGAAPLTTVALNDNQAVAAPAIAIPVANTFCFILYSIQRTPGTFEGGMMVLLNDGTTADLSIDSGAIGSNGVALSADVSGGNVRVLYTSTATGFAPTLKYAVLKWAA